MPLYAYNPGLIVSVRQTFATSWPRNVRLIMEDSLVTANFDIASSQSVDLDSLTTDIGAGTITRDDTYEKFYFTSVSAVALVSIVGNLIVIIVMLRTKRLRIPTNYFMISLAVSDLMIGVTYPLYNFGHLPGFVLTEVFGEYARNVFYSCDEGNDLSRKYRKYSVTACTRSNIFRQWTTGGKVP